MLDGTICDAILGIFSWVSDCRLSGRRPAQYLVDGAKALCAALKSWISKKEVGYRCHVYTWPRPTILSNGFRSDLRCVWLFEWTTVLVSYVIHLACLTDGFTLGLVNCLRNTHLDTVILVTK